MIATSPNHDGVEGTDCGEVWIVTEEDALLIMRSPDQGFWPCTCGSREKDARLRGCSAPEAVAYSALSNAGGIVPHPRPASLARRMAWARSATCNLLKTLET